MRLLFEIDTKDYDINGKGYIRPSARAIIIKNKKVAMVYSKKYNYYKFPGGGIEKGESNIDALLRETKEEAGFIIKDDSIKEYGWVRRITKSNEKNIDYFLQENFYYICDIKKDVVNQELDEYENDEGFTLEWVLPKHAINTNRNFDHGNINQTMLEREALVLLCLIDEGYFD